MHVINDYDVGCGRLPDILIPVQKVSKAPSSVLLVDCDPTCPFHRRLDVTWV